MCSSDLHAAELARAQAQAELERHAGIISGAEERGAFLNGRVEDLIGRLDDLAGALASRAQERSTIETQVALDRAELKERE